MRKKIGRPPKLQEHDLQELVEKFDKYIEETEIPIISEFAYLNNIEKTYLYDRAEFSTLLKKCIAKKESQLEKGSLMGVLNSTQAIFSLKQLGWSDKRELSINPIKVESTSKLTDEQLDQIESILKGNK